MYPFFTHVLLATRYWVAIYPRRVLVCAMCVRTRTYMLHACTLCYHWAGCTWTCQRTMSVLLASCYSELMAKISHNNRMLALSLRSPPRRCPLV